VPYAFAIVLSWGRTGAIAALVGAALVAACTGETEFPTTGPPATPTPVPVAPTQPPIGQADFTYVEALCVAVENFALDLDGIDEDLSDVVAGTVTAPAARLAEIQALAQPPLKNLLIGLEGIVAPAHLAEWHHALVDKAEGLALSLSEGDLASVRVYVQYPFPETLPAVTARLQAAASAVSACTAVSARILN